MKRTSLARPTPREALRLVRLQRRLSQRAVARRLGLCQATYSLIETGCREVSDHERATLARVLRARVEELFPDQVPA